MGTGSFPGVKWPGCGADHQPPSSAKVTKGYSYTSNHPLGQFRPVTGLLYLLPNFTTMVTGHSKIKSYLQKHKILDGPMCSCKSEEQTVDHILFDCKLLEQERDRLKAAVLWSENWPVSKNTLINKYKKTSTYSHTIYLLINYRE
jgi:hypothetical protein